MVGERDGLSTHNDSTNTLLDYNAVGYMRAHGNTHCRPYILECHICSAGWRYLWPKQMVACLPLHAKFTISPRRMCASHKQNKEKKKLLLLLYVHTIYYNILLLPFLFSRLFVRVFWRCESECQSRNLSSSSAKILQITCGVPCGWHITIITRVHMYTYI